MPALLLMLLRVSLVRCFPAHRPIGRTSRGFLRYFACRSTRGCRTLSHVDDFSLRCCMMRRFVLCEQLHWLQWLNFFFFVSLSSPMLVVLLAALGRNDTQKACLCWNLMVLACRALRLLLLFSTRRLIVEFFPLM
jgi:hypothetical protein